MGNDGASRNFCINVRWQGVYFINLYSVDTQASWSFLDARVVNDKTQEARF